MNISDAAKIISNKIISASTPLIVAIDGRCASGKTTLAKEIKNIIGQSENTGSKSCLIVIHMDDFFLRPEQRTHDRLQIPGENIDHERFLNEVLIPLKEKQSFFYRPFSCRTQSFDEPVFVQGGQSVLIEGSYSCHPNLRGYYDMRIFLSTDKKTQTERITARNGAASEMFFNKWIPLEELYFSSCHVSECCEISVET